MRGESRNTRRETCLSVSLSETKYRYTGLGSKPSIRSDRPADNQLRNGMAYSTKKLYLQIQLVPNSKHTAQSNAVIHSAGTKQNFWILTRGTRSNYHHAL